MAYQQQPPYNNQYGQQGQGYYPQGQGYPQGPGYPQQPASNVGWAPNVGVPPTMNYHANPNNAENGDDNKYSGAFSDATIRAGFIRKVFFMVTIMLAVVAIFSSIPFYSTDLKLFVRQNQYLYYISYGTFLVTYLVLMCCESVRRSFPGNLIATAVLTLAIAYMTMMICSMYNLQAVMLCFVITTVVCGSIIIFASQTRYDLTSMMGYVFIFSMVLMVFGIVAIIGSLAFHVRWLYMIYAGLASLLFMVYLAIDIQMIMGGRKFEIDPEDYIFAAIQVFLDIVYIFWMLLSLIGGSRRDD
uniref:Protein lifeguard 1 n=1 Tax=Panagrellus redivivus TaxID=6233 RepID=A0A7E4VJP8_PANRE